jgi:hypothetical protein
MTDWSEYVRRWVRLSDSSPAELSRAAGFGDGSNISRWSTAKAVANPELAVRFAVAVGRPPLEALVAAGHITPEAAQLSQIPADAAQFSDAELVLAVERRLAELRNATVHRPPTAAAATATPPRRDDYTLARRVVTEESEGRRGSRLSRERGEESQDPGGDEPA